jgi:two-component sensor histidine kinase
VITGKNIRLSPNVTLALGIAFHELATNAVKYGAFSNGAGSILLAWTVEPKNPPDVNRQLGVPLRPPRQSRSRSHAAKFVFYFGNRELSAGHPL